MVPAFLSLVLFVRLDAADVLAHDLRRTLLDRLRDAPGLTVGEAAALLEVDYKTAQHHARILARAGKLVLVPDGRARRCFLPGARRLRPPTPRVVEALLAVRGGHGTPTLLGRALGIPRGTAGSLLSSLVRQGLLERRDGRHRLTPAAEEALAAHESFTRGADPGGGWPDWDCAR